MIFISLSRWLVTGERPASTTRLGAASTVQPTNTIQYQPQPHATKGTSFKVGTGTCTWRLLRRCCHALPPSHGGLCVNYCRTRTLTFLREMEPGSRSASSRSSLHTCPAAASALPEEGATGRGPQVALASGCCRRIASLAGPPRPLELPGATWSRLELRAAKQAGPGRRDPGRELLLIHATNQPTNQPTNQRKRAGSWGASQRHTSRSGTRGPA